LVTAPCALQLAEETIMVQHFVHYWSMEYANERMEYPFQRIRGGAILWEPWPFC